MKRAIEGKQRELE